VVEVRGEDLEEAAEGEWVLEHVEGDCLVLHFGVADLRVLEGRQWQWQWRYKKVSEWVVERSCCKVSEDFQYDNVNMLLKMLRQWWRWTKQGRCLQIVVEEVLMVISV
jgi:hypothetical protein